MHSTDQVQSEVIDLHTGLRIYRGNPALHVLALYGLPYRPESISLGADIDDRLGWVEGQEKRTMSKFNLGHPVFKKLPVRLSQ